MDGRIEVEHWKDTDVDCCYDEWKEYDSDKTNKEK